ncbi:MAG: DNA glycosylase [Ruminococcus sp.]|nr:DNA glycosylase [Ruminococcus sp.]
MDFTVSGNDIILRQPDFALSETLDCGQAFRWKKVSDDSDRCEVYEGYFLNSFLRISEGEEKGVFILHNTQEKDFLDKWYNYLDLSTDYGELKRRFSEDEMLARACSYAGGIRILRQDSWEALSSFIISQNNNIPRIKGIIGRLTEHYGGYPEVSQLAGETAESLAFLRSGFRAKYLTDAVERLLSGELDLASIARLPLQDALKELMKIRGVGPKVAMCTLLFGMHRTDAFPVDVWMKRVLERWYPNGLPDCVKGCEGIAQQYLFHYIRNEPV